MQNLMNQDGLSAMLVSTVNNSVSPEIATIAIEGLILLLQNATDGIQESLLAQMKGNKDNYQFFAYLRERLHVLTMGIVRDIEQRKGQREQIE